MVTCVRGCFDCLELDAGDKRIECLWARIIRKDKITDSTVRVYYRPSSQDEEAEEVFYKQLGEVSPSLVLVLVEDFNLTGVCWEFNAAEESPRGSWMCRRKLPEAADEQASKGRYPTGPVHCEQRTGGWCDGWRWSWTQWYKIIVFNSLRSKVGIQQNFHLGADFQQNFHLWPV